MKYVIMSNGTIPGYGVRGPVLTPRTYNIHQVLKWLAVGVDVREVMEDGSFRKLHFNDPKLVEEANKDLDKQRIERNRIEEEVKAMGIKPKNKPSKKQVQFVPVVEEQNKKNKKVEHKKPVEEIKEEVKEEVTENKKPSFEVDELKPME